MLLTEFRQRYPQYDDLSDAELADGLYRKFYSDVPRFEFDQKIGLGVNSEPGWTGDPNAIATPPDLTPRFPGGAGLPSVGFEMQQPVPLPQPSAPPMTPMTPMPSGPPATTGAVPVMPGLTQELDLDEDRWAVGGAGGLDFATSALPPIPAQGTGPFERFVSEWAPPQAPPQDALAPVPLPSDPYSGTPDWQGYPGLVARGAAETGLTMGRGLEALPQHQTDETRAFYDEYLSIQPGDRDTAEDLVRRVQRSRMTPTRKAAFTQAIVQTVRDGSKVGTRDLGIDVPIDTATGERYDRAREVVRQTFPASQEQERSLLGQTMTGIGSTAAFLPFSMLPGGVWAAGALAGAGEASERAYRAGASAEDQGTATTLGMVPGAIDALSIDSIIRGVTRTPGAAGWLRSIVLTGLRTGAIEGTTEGVQQAVQNVIARATYDPDAAIAEGVPENALVGFLSGGALGAAGGVFSRPDRSPVATMPDRQEPPALDPTRAAPGVPRGTEAERPAPDDAVAAAREARRQADEVMRRAAETRARNADRLGLLPDGSSPPVLPGPNDAQTFDRGSLPAGAQPGEAIIGPVEPAAPPPTGPTPQPAPPRVPQVDLPQAPGFPTDRDIGVRPVPESELRPGEAAPAEIGPGVRVRIETPSGPAEGVVVEEFQEPRPEQPGAPGAVTAPAYAVQLDSGETVDVAPDRARIEVVEPARSVPEASANAMPEPAAAPSEQANIEQTPSERAPATLAPEPAAVASADARTERGPSAPAAPRLSGPLQAARIIDSDTAITPAGTDVPVRYAVVELDSLTPSQTDDGNPNPQFTGEQPRDRSRAASQAQVAEIASRLDPRRLDRNPSTADGAPLVGPDGMVDSGNGRILAIRRAYRQGLPSAYRYRQHLVEQGYPVEGMQRPVLVRINDAAPDMRARIASESNARSTLAMSATEQAMADARAMATILPTYRGGDVTAAVNRDFVRRFIDQAVGAGDRASVIDSQGQLSGPGIRRIQAAMLAAAYGNANIVETLVESADSDIKAIGGALVDAAPAWAQMRQEAEAGQIDPAVADVTKDLLEAVRLVQRARSEGQHVADLAAQMDMFGGRTISVRGEAFLRLFFRDLRYRSQRGRPKIAQALTYYATEARKAQPGPGLFGDADRATPAGILENARRQADGPDQQQDDLLGSRPARDGRDGEGLPPAGGDAGRGAPVQSPDGAGDRGPAAEPARGADAGGLSDPVEPQPSSRGAANDLASPNDLAAPEAAEAAEPEPPRTASREAARRAARIEDFGERLEGARKDYAQRLRDAGSVDIATTPLSQSWPEPDYQRLLDQGASPWVVAFVHAARDEVPTKPQSGWKLQNWVNTVRALRGFASDLLDGKISEERLRQALRAPENERLEKGVVGRADLYAAVGHGRSLKGLRLTEGHYSMWNRVRYDPPKVVWTVERETSSVSMMRNWPRTVAEGATREEAIRNFRAAFDRLQDKPAPAKDVSFEIYAYRTGPKAGRWWIGKKMGTLNRIDLRDFASAKEARAYLTEHQAELVEMLERAKKVPNERRETNAPRVGHDYRGGGDVSPDMFSATFGFRGVQFGNWVEGDRRQQSINEAFDGLMDLAGVLGIPPRALSLNGELGLAFGSRGRGGKNPAAAHFEPDKIVINLTKEHGAGSLAHEWWHSLDNYFARRRGERNAYLTQNPTVRGEGVRPEMVEAFREVMAALGRTEIGSRSRDLDRRRSKPYWSTPIEMSARAFETYVIAKLQDQGLSNDYLANIVSQEAWDVAMADIGGPTSGASSYPYPTAGETIEIRGAFDAFFRTIETRETEEGRTALYQAPRTVEAAPPFYSAFTRGVEAVKIGRGPREQWLGIVRNLAQKGVKQAEIEWSGIETWLREVEGPITKDKVLDYLRSQEVQVQEVLKDNEIPGEVYERAAEDGTLDETTGGEFLTKYDQYTLPGGENYRELLLTLPARDVVTTRASVAPAGWGDIDGGNVGVEVQGDRGNDYRSGHFDEPNVLAHIRLNERTGPNGERVLFIEEIQSDWHQAGRKRGYQGDNAVRPDSLILSEAQGEEVGAPGKYWFVAPNGQRVPGWGASQAEARNKAAAFLNATAANFGVPNAPLRTTWQETAFRRAVRWAAENGFDRVAWTTGEQQAERFDLSKHIDSLKVLEGRYEDVEGYDGYQVVARKNGREVIDRRVAARDLPDVIGKEMADKVVAQIEENKKRPVPRYSAEFSGLDLKVGGEGMRGFYDRILPAYANKFGKPFGARAEMAPVSAGGGDVAVHSLPVTPEMRESVMRDGVPLWQSGQEGTSPTTPLDPEALKAELRRIAPLASLEVIERIVVAGRGPMTGAYYPAFRAVVVAATGPDPMNTLRHEAVHALRDLNLIRPEEWRRLSARAEAEWIGRYDIEARYPSLSREGQIEEAVAEAFADHVERPLPPGLRSVWENVKRFLDRLGAWLRGQGFQTVEDVLGRIERGEVGARDVASGQGRGTAAAFQVPRVRGTTRQETAIDKAIEPTDLRGIGTRILEAVAATRERVSEEWRWALADDLDGIKRAAKAAGGVDRLDRELPAYVAARFARHHAGQVEAFLRYGAPEWNAAERMVAIKPGSRGLFQIIEPLQRAGLSRLFEGYAYARRVDSQGLIAQGRERNLTPGDVQELLDLAQKHPEFVTIFDEIQAYKKAFVDLAEATGLINAQQRQTWEQMDHIPFYRVAEEAGVKAPFSGKGLANQGPGIRRLTGGDQRFVVIESATGNVVARHVERADATADAQARGGGYTVETAGEPIPSVIENVARNVSHLLSSSMKNYAAHLAVADAITIGAAKRRPMGMKQALVPTAQIQAAAQAAGVNVGGWPPNQIQALWAIVPPSDPDVASVRVAGKQEFYEVSDRLLLRALTALHETALHPVMKALASVRSFFTRTITLDPGFMIRNFVRDSMAQWVQSDSRSLNFPLEMGRSLKNAMAAFRSDDRIKTIMAAGADTGFYANRPEQVKKQIETLKKNYKADLLSLTYNPKRWIEVLEKIGRASEMANRLATYDATMRKTGSQRDAAFEAMDALDFQMRPGSAWVQGFTAIVPFLNARIQGLYRLGRGLAANPKRFAAAGGMLAVFSTILALFNAEDDEEGGYNDLPEYIKDAAWIIPVWRLLGLAGADAWKWAEENDLPRFLMIPKPFEVGIIFGTVPERFVQALYGNDRAKDTIRSAAHAVMDTLAFNPLANPVSAVPLQWAFNHDFFRGQPIESRSVQNLPPGQRANASTGATARLVGEALDVSPAKMEMAVRGFFGTMGAYTLAAVDEVTAALSGQPPAIPRRWDQVPAIRSFIRQDPVASTKWTERFYDLRRQVNEAAAGVKEYEDRGETEKAARAEREAAPQLEERRGLNATGRSLAANRAAQDLLRNFERLPEAEKRAATREFASLFKEIAENPENRPVNLRLRNVAPKMRALSGKAELPPGAKRDIADAIIWSNNGLARSAAKEAEERIAAAKRKTSPSPSPSAKTSP